MPNFQQRGTLMRASQHASPALVASVIATLCWTLAAPVDTSAQAPDSALRRVRAMRVSGVPPRIDGRLDDALWRDAEFTSGFVQREPREGEPASERTEVAFAYDE